MSSRKSLVLVVDDIQSNIEFITDILSSVENIEVKGADNGKTALELISRTPPDLILLDVSMPVMDGFEVCNKLKASAEFSDIPVIFLTARVQKEDIIHGFEVGAVDYISKPFNLNELLSRVKTHLELRHKSKEFLEVNLHLEEKIAERTKQLMDANKELSEANEKLSRMYEELSTLDSAKSDFIAHINHELRTPLNGILGYTSLLEDSLQPEGREQLKSINALIKRLIRVAEISLLLTELRSSDNKINIRNIELSNIVEKAVPLEEVQKKNIEVEIRNIDRSELIYAEPRLLINCIGLILDNAVKYSPINGKITIEGRDNVQFFSIGITDNGPGFSSVALSNLFELFKADNLDHKSYGFGLGLATSKKILDLMGGKINIRNTREGASVIVHLRRS